MTFSQQGKVHHVNERETSVWNEIQLTVFVCGSNLVQVLGMPLPSFFVIVIDAAKTQDSPSSRLYESSLQGAIYHV
jgi:hypothetical protein